MQEAVALNVLCSGVLMIGKFLLEVGKQLCG